MTALFQVIILYAVIFISFNRLGLKSILLMATIVSLPLRTTYEFLAVSHKGWTNGISITMADVCIIMLALSQMGRQSEAAQQKLHFSKPILFLIMACGVSILNTEWLRMTTFQIIALSQMALLYYVVLNRCLVDREDLRAIHAGLCVSLILQGIIGSLQFMMRHNFMLFSTGIALGETIIVDDQAPGEFIRVFGTLGKPNAYGSHMAILLLLCIVTGRIDHGRPWLHRLSLILGGTGLILSFSRGAWASMIAALLAFCWILQRWKVFSLKRTLATTAVVLLLFLPMLPFITTRLTADDHNAAMSRVPLMSIAWNMIKAHPFIGVGGNTYASRIRDYLPQDYPQGYVDQVHNFYLLVFAECGAVGLAALLWLMGSIARTSRDCMECEADDRVRHLGAAVLVVTVQIACFALVDTNNNKMAVSTLFILCAFLQFALRLAARDESVIPA